jgi:outer membrane protein assembly factor BamB
MACFGYDSVTALNLRNGRRRWTVPVDIEDGIGIGIAAEGNRVITVNETTVSALGARSGRRIWTHRADFAHSPQVCYGLVFFCDFPGTVHALRADNGQPVWKKPIAESVFESFGFGSGGGLVYFGTPEGDILALRAATGELMWSRRLGSRASRNQWNALGVSVDKLLVGATDQHVYALHRSDGRTMWTYPADVTIRTSAPVAVEKMVFIGTSDGFVKAIDPPGDG